MNIRGKHPTPNIQHSTSIEYEMGNGERNSKGTSNSERRTLNAERSSPCSLRLLTPALSSFGEERETESSRVLRRFRNFTSLDAWGGLDL